MAVNFTSGDQRTRERDWMISQILALPTLHEKIQPSDWAEKTRYLPPHVTARPGFYRYEAAPFLREIVDCLSPYSPVEIVDYMKGVQIGATVGVLENGIGYYIEHVKDAPMMLMSTDADLVKLRVEKYIIPMLEHSDLYHLIQSNDSRNPRKTGLKESSIEWLGGGFLLTFGANSPGKLRSTSIMVLLEDEIDSYATRAGKDGKPGALAEDRTTTYEHRRKIFRISTPLLDPSPINEGFLSGDRRLYMVPCKGCGKYQSLKWDGVDRKTGNAWGMRWKTTSAGLLVPGSTRYLCKFCQHEHRHADVSYWYRDGGRHCAWEPTADPDQQNHRSYHTPAYYSSFESWDKQVIKYLRSYDPTANRVKDLELHQQFYNNVLGSPYRAVGEKLSKQRVQLHRRMEYHEKMVPNKLAIEETGHPIYALTLAVDVHKSHLDVLVMGMGHNRIGYGIEHRVIEGDCTSLDNEPWVELKKMIDTKQYASDDGKVYPIAISLIDAGYNSDLAYGFSAPYAAGVFPIMGRATPQKNAVVKEFQPFVSKLGTTGYNIVVDLYKDRCASALRRERPDSGALGLNHLNFPQEFTDRFFDELCKEYKREVVNARTGQRVGFEWYRPGGGNAPNEGWDLLVYCCAGYDMVVADVCLRLLEMEVVELDVAYTELEEGMFWFDSAED